MSRLQSLLKPCYLYRPRVLLHRLWTEFNPPKGLTATVPLPWGSDIDVSLEDALGREIYKQRLFDIAVTETLWRLTSPGDSVIDAGANIGYMTSLMAAKVGPSGAVHSFEPHPQILPRLRANVERCNTQPSGGRINLHEAALSDNVGMAELAETAYFGFNQGTASLAKRQQVADQKEITRSHQVSCTTLDTEFPEGRFALMKLDVEGFELNVLKGGLKLLEQQRVDNIIYEAHENEESGVHKFLTDRGFRILAIGYHRRGLTLTEHSSTADLDRSWESPSYLATLDPDGAKSLLCTKGWKVFL